MSATHPPDRPGYQLEFNEMFDTSTLDPSRWLPYYLPHWSGRARSAARYTLPGNGLALHITSDQQPWLPEIDGALRVSCLQTGARSGALGSRDGQHRFHPDLRVREPVETTRLYTPQFGYFETRVRAVPIPGYMLALWMIGFEERPHESGEICIFELFGQDLTSGAATVRYGVHPFGDPTLREEFYADTLTMDASAFHTYALDWQPDRLHFYVDGALLRTVWQSPQYPMQFMLTLYELPAQLQECGAPWPRTAHVAYLRGYGRTQAR
ncbi:hypothetical protein HNQ07_003611 [Deinococcus metalli]|uniref:GH16 domain-containing protein n=1 Tax=Deinococcus metalli TaxID=1141878 RepID=A0A7W8NRP9_9DEIO|nr:glycoside hydrolase family 16 protein [Deinococcus metalli]MBB5378110.1 hypothetical protein [Deinococcus metalli]GHF54517.1 hypothetical protein GCM10017781_33540 [Deinococcus metalli]